VDLRDAADEQHYPVDRAPEGEQGVAGPQPVVVLDAEHEPGSARHRDNVASQGHGLVEHLETHQVRTELEVDAGGKGTGERGPEHGAEVGQRWLLDGCVVVAVGQQPGVQTGQRVQVIGVVGAVAPRCRHRLPADAGLDPVAPSALVEQPQVNGRTDR
jgi:hypothetical protein